MMRVAVMYVLDIWKMLKSIVFVWLMTKLMMMMIFELLVKAFGWFNFIHFGFHLFNTCIWLSFYFLDAYNDDTNQNDYTFNPKYKLWMVFYVYSSLMAHENATHDRYTCASAKYYAQQKPIEATDRPTIWTDKSYIKPFHRWSMCAPRNKKKNWIVFNKYQIHYDRNEAAYWPEYQKIDISRKRCRAVVSIKSEHLLKTTTTEKRILSHAPYPR